MNHFAKIALVALLTAVSLGHGASPPPVSAASQSGRYTGPVIVHQHTYTKAYRRVMAACVGGDESWEHYRACLVQHPDNGQRCLRVEEWYDTVPQTFKILRDEC